jgi:hypothetical protein
MVQWTTIWICYMNDSQNRGEAILFYFFILITETVKPGPDSAHAPPSSFARRGTAESMSVRRAQKGLWYKNYVQKKTQRIFCTFWYKSYVRSKLPPMLSLDRRHRKSTLFFEEERRIRLLLH